MKRPNKAVVGLLMVTAVAVCELVAADAAGAANANVTATHTVVGATYQGGWAGIWAGGPGNYSVARGGVDAIGHFTAAVSCMSVSGNDGVVTALITTSVDSNYPVGEYIVVEAVDNGGPGDLWRISFQNNGGIQQVGPACYAPIYPPVPIQQGHVLVR